MKKIILSLTVIVVFLLYSFQKKSTTPSLTPTTTTRTSPGVQRRLFGDDDHPVITAPTQAPASTTQGQNGQMMGQGMMQYRNGVYTGDVVDAYYGNVQVKATVQGGKIADVQFLDYPKDRSTSVEINTQAMPILISEAIQSQTANVNIVSGATQTSLAFQKSLQFALNQAQ